MKWSFKLCEIFGISINIHITLFLLFIFFWSGSITSLFIILGIFFFVTVHELCHSLVARIFGVKVREITLLPIGGVASMTSSPKKPMHEFLISLAGPLSNIVIVVVFFYPLKAILGEKVLFSPYVGESFPHAVAYVYWLNLVLAGFNLIPAFPMDGGRIVRALLATKLGIKRATRIAVTIGKVCAVGFGFFGLINHNMILVIIALFIFISASSEAFQVDITETLKKFKVRDILPHDFVTVRSDAPLGKVLELIFHSHQHDFPVVDDGKLVGFVCGEDIKDALSLHGNTATIESIMRKTFPEVKESDSLIKVQTVLQSSGMRAIPVTREGNVVGIVTAEDIGRVYTMLSNK